MDVQQLVVMHGSVLKRERLMKLHEISVPEGLHLLRVVVFNASWLKAANGQKLCRRKIDGPSRKIQH